MTPRIERAVTVSWRHQVLFTQNIFDAENAVLRDTLADDRTTSPCKDCDDKKVVISKYFDKEKVNDAAWPLWEAWQFTGDIVWDGERDANGTNKMTADTFSLPHFGKKDTKGSATAIGEVKGFPGIELPEGMKPTGRAPTGILPTTMKEPFVWSHSEKGAPHQFSIKKWNNCALFDVFDKDPTYTSIPASK